MGRAVSLVCLLFAGCSLDTGVTSTSDTGGIDAFVGVLDTGPRADTGVDALVVDAGIDAFTPPVDSGMDAFVPVDMGTDAFTSPDMGHDAFVPPVDAFTPPDMFVPGDASTPCDRSYGAVAGYHPCSSVGTSATSCTFYVHWPSGNHSCDEACTGGRCTSAIGNADGSQCTDDGNRAFPCSQGFRDAICTCAP